MSQVVSMHCEEAGGEGITNPVTVSHCKACGGSNFDLPDTQIKNGQQVMKVEQEKAEQP